MSDDQMRYVASWLPELGAPPGWAWTPWMFWGRGQTWDGSRIIIRELWPISGDHLRNGYRDRAVISEQDLALNLTREACADLALAAQEVACLCVVNAELAASQPPTQ